MVGEATDVMTPLTQECAGKEAQALPESPASHWHTKALLSAGRPGADPCAVGAVSAHLEGCTLCLHGVPSC